MQKAKAFFLVCAGLFLLALSYHLGATNVQGQAGSQVTGLSAAVWQGSYSYFVMTPSGDLYSKAGSSSTLNPGPPQFMGNFWDGATATEQSSWGQVKNRYRK
jgi:hypothetical protein